MFDDDLLRRHFVLALDQSEPRIDLGHAVTGVLYLLHQLGTAQPQHHLQLGGIDALAQEFPDLLQCEAQLLEGDDSFEFASWSTS